MSPRLHSDLAASVSKARAEQGDPRGAVEAALDSMLANQRAVSEAMKRHPDPDWAEAQARAEWHAEEYETDRMWGREDE